MIEYHVNTTRNGMPTHVYQTIGSFWNAAEMKLHVNSTCFHASLKSQTGMSSFRLSCERTLRGVIISRVLWKFSSLSYHEPNLLLIARETMRLLVNPKLIPIAIQPKSISLEQIRYYKRSQDIAVTSLYCLLF